MNTNKKVLILTVGGSPKPLVSSIEYYQPDEIIFICTKQSKNEVEGIIEKINRSNDIAYFVKEVSPDDTDDIFRVSSEVISNYQAIGSNILADFTGGTKCMSFTLATAASLMGVPLRFMTGDRSGLIKVADGTEQPLNFNFLWIEFEMGKRLFNKGDYAAAERIFLRIKEKTFSNKLRSESGDYAKLAKGLDLWDKFDHQAAFENIRVFYDQYPTLIRFLERIIKPDNDNANRYELITDLLANTERCSAQERFDDGCARLYRVVELLAQKRLLLEHNIDTSNVDPKKFPANFKPPEPNKKGIYQLNRYKAYDLLEKLNDLVSKIYSKHRKKIDNNMELRNNSIMAHGITPIRGHNYRVFSEVVVLFLKEAFGVLGIKWEEIHFPRID